MANRLAEYFRKQLSKPTKEEVSSEAEKATFILLHQELHLGTLEFNEGIWSFEYSLIYRQLLKKMIESGNTQNAMVLPLFAFPDVDKKYESSNLWPFFTARIPGLKQPEVQNIMTSDNIKSTDLVRLLKRFGQKTIINPFELHLS